MKKYVIPAAIASLLAFVMITISTRLAGGFELFGSARGTGRWI